MGSYTLTCIKDPGVITPDYYLENYVLNKEMSIFFWNDYLLYTPSYYVKGDDTDKKLILY